MKAAILRCAVAWAALGFVAGAHAETLTLGKKAKLEGLITHRAGASMTVKVEEGGGSVVVLLNPNTEVRASKHSWGVFKKDAAATALIPGLKVKVEGVGDAEGRLIGTKVRFTDGDLEAAQTIAAGLAETKDQVAAHGQDIDTLKEGQAALNRRFGALDEYDLKAEATVYFELGSAAISPEGAAELARVSEAAKPLKGYLVGVEGYADASGNAAVNQKLSLERSQAVVNWLAQQGGIPFLRMLAPGAMSTYQPAASNETAAGRAQNRRVVVRVLVNRGIAEP